MNPVGKPDAGNRHVRFDERGEETERCRMAQVTAPLLDSTRFIRATRRPHSMVRPAFWISGTQRLISDWIHHTAHGSSAFALQHSLLGRFLVLNGV